MQEQPDENLDDDEDKKNPAYIPRKGAFYEHDMRLDPDEEVPVNTTEPEEKRYLVHLSLGPVPNTSSPAQVAQW